MKIHGAVIKEQGVTFAVVVVKESAMSSNHVASETIRSFESYFPGMPIVLASPDTQKYRGRKDLAEFLASIDSYRIPWKEYTFSD